MKVLDLDDMHHKYLRMGFCLFKFEKKFINHKINSQDFYWQKHENITQNFWCLMICFSKKKIMKARNYFLQLKNWYNISVLLIYLKEHLYLTNIYIVYGNYSSTYLLPSWQRPRDYKRLSWATSKWWAIHSFCASSWAKDGMTKSTYTALNISMPQCATCSPTKFQYSSKIRPLVAISLTGSMPHLLLHIWAELMPCSLPVLWHIVTKNVEEIPQMWECPRIGHYERAGEWMSRNEYSASVFPPNSSSG